jgi:XTP/dITP diphosphohydrolase
VSAWTGFSACSSSSVRALAADTVLLLATRSHDKAREIRDILAPVLGGRILALDEAGIAPLAEEDHIEIFDTFLANAHAKAAYFLRRASMSVLADDSGLEVDALGGAPGVRSRRFAGRPDLDGRELDGANNDRLIAELRGLPAEARSARYVCAAVLHLSDGRRLSALGSCRGSILPEPRGNAGFGYDPLFLDPATGLSFGETHADEKNRRSHRARAFRALTANLPA